MAKDKLKTVYVCTQCGETSPRWLGRCPSCGAWNTMVEDVVAEPAKTSAKAAGQSRTPGQTSLKPLKLNLVSTTEEKKPDRHRHRGAGPGPGRRHRAGQRDPDRR